MGFDRDKLKGYFTGCIPINVVYGCIWAWKWDVSQNGNLVQVRGNQDWPSNLGPICLLFKIDWPTKDATGIAILTRLIHLPSGILLGNLGFYEQKLPYFDLSPPWHFSDIISDISYGNRQHTWRNCMYTLMCMCDHIIICSYLNTSLHIHVHIY